MLGILLWIWIGAIACESGRRLVTAFLPRVGRSENIVALSLGYGLLSYAVFALATFQLLLLWLVATVMIVASVAWCANNLPRFALKEYSRGGWSQNLWRWLRRQRSSFLCLSLFERILLCLILLILFRNFLGALTPELRHDSLNYHLNFPNLYVIRGGIYETPWHALSYMPSNVEMLYTLALLAGSDVLAKLMHFGFGLVVAASIYSIGKRYFNQKTGIFAAFLWVAMPLVAYESSTAYIDLGVAMWTTVGLYTLLRHLEASGLIEPANRESAQRNGSSTPLKWMFLSALVSGFALGSKYTVAIVHFLPLSIALLTVAIYVPRTSLKRLYPLRLAFRDILVMNGTGLVLVGPWLVLNSAWTGNPVYPLFNRFFGLTKSWQIEAEQLFRAQSPQTYELLSLILNIPSRLNLLGQNGTVLLHLAVTAGAVILVRNLFERVRVSDKSAVLHVVLLAYLLSAFIAWACLTTNADGRFLLPAFAAVCLLVAEGCLHIAEWFARLSESARIRWLFLYAVVAMLVWNHLTRVSRFYHDLGESPWPVLGENNQKEYVLSRRPDLSIAFFINSHLPVNSRVVGIGFPCRREYVSHVQAGQHPLKDATRGGTQTLDETIRQAGFTHVVYPGGVSLPSSDVEKELAEEFETIFLSEKAGLYRLKETK